MLLVCILLFLIAANIIGCIGCKKRRIKIFLGIAAGIWVLLAAAGGLFIYEDTYQITEIDVSESPDGAYELFFQQVGEPDWPFGNTHARLVLKDGKKIIVKYSFDIADDGCTPGTRNWRVSWSETAASVIISGSEQADWEYDLYFDGTIENHRLETVNDNTSTETQSDNQLQSEFEEDNSEEQTNSQLDEDGYPLDEEYQAYKRELYTISETIDKSEYTEPEYKLNSKGYPYAVISRDLNSNSGEYTELCLVFNEQYQGDAEHEFVLEKYHYAADGTESSSPEVVDFYLIDSTDLEVTDEHTSTWH